MRRETLAHRDARRAFREEVFRLWGDRCHFCGRMAVDPMHVLPRSILSKHQRYACAVLNGRPGCRACHRRQEHGDLRFADDIYDIALAALRLLGTVRDPRTGEVA